MVKSGGTSVLPLFLRLSGKKKLPLSDERSSLCRYFILSVMPNGGFSCFRARRERFACCQFNALSVGIAITTRFRNFVICSMLVVSI